MCNFSSVIWPSTRAQFTSTFVPTATPSVEGDFPDTILQLWAGEPSRGLTVIESALMAEHLTLDGESHRYGVLTGLESLHGLPISAAAL